MAATTPSSLGMGRPSDPSAVLGLPPLRQGRGAAPFLAGENEGLATLALPAGSLPCAGWGCRRPESIGPWSSGTRTRPESAYVAWASSRPKVLPDGADHGVVSAALVSVAMFRDSACRVSSPDRPRRFGLDRRAAHHQPGDGPMFIMLAGMVCSLSWARCSLMRQPAPRAGVERLRPIAGCWREARPVPRASSLPGCDATPPSRPSPPAASAAGTTGPPGPHSFSAPGSPKRCVAPGMMETPW